MKTSELVNLIAAALVKAQASINHAGKDAQNPHFRNDYASLESVIDAGKKALLEQGIAVIQCPGDGVLTTRLQHSSGQFYEVETKLLLTKLDMQGLGSAITYARRYALAAMTNIAQVDDDGNLASSKGVAPTMKRKSVEKPALSGTPKKEDTDF